MGAALRTVEKIVYGERFAGCSQGWASQGQSHSCGPLTHICLTGRTLLKFSRMAVRPWPRSYPAIHTGELNVPDGSRAFMRNSSRVILSKEVRELLDSGENL